MKRDMKYSDDNEEIKVKEIISSCLQLEDEANKIKNKYRKDTQKAELYSNPFSIDKKKEKPNLTKH